MNGAGKLCFLDGFKLGVVSANWVDTTGNRSFTVAARKLLLQQRVRDRAARVSKPFLVSSYLPDSTLAITDCLDQLMAAWRDDVAFDATGKAAEESGEGWLLLSLRRVKDYFL